VVERAAHVGGRPSDEEANVELGYAISSEEHRPLDLVRNAALAEEAGFTFALVSDHFHPWIDRQGESAFVWSVLGGIALATERLVVGTGVTCPTIRIHPAIVAQAAATAASMLPGRFFLGVGTGENLNEHVLGQRWPSTEIRREMLEEAVDVMRELWRGELTSHRGRHYTVENARIYTLPEEEIEVMVAAGGPEAAELAGRIGDGLVGTSPEGELLAAFDEAGGAGKPRYGQVTVCWAGREPEARRTAFEWWPNAALQGPLAQELPLPSHFEAASGMVGEDDVAEAIVCGPDPEAHIAKIDEYREAGYTHVYVHQVGPDQEGFFRFYTSEILPHYERVATRAGHR
jgi:coenzyme F420-dependent glucose-6-phosphate dehydrogenase